MSEDESEGQRLLERYQEIVSRLMQAQEELEGILIKLRGHDIYPSPVPPIRFRMRDERNSVTHKFAIGGPEGIDGYFTTGLYDDGTPGEIYIEVARTGNLANGLFDCFAVLFSTALQFGVPLERIVDKLKHTKFLPDGWTENPKIRTTTSVVDYFMRWMESHFLQKETTQ